MPSQCSTACTSVLTRLLSLWLKPNGWGGVLTTLNRLSFSCGVLEDSVAAHLVRHTSDCVRRAVVNALHCHIALCLQRVIVSVLEARTNRLLSGVIRLRAEGEERRWMNMLLQAMGYLK